ncbi:MAG: hypothetical protein HY262_02220 [Chloroflexi bacterium]|nr:hypothetical protein [Chloroflexota bacterium]
MDPSAFVDSLQRGLREVPPIAIALVLLAGPTAALIGYRWVGAGRRGRKANEASAVPFWVCHDCRSVNELRASRCYRCGVERDDIEAVEVVVDQPAVRTVPVDLPAGSPFSAVMSAGRTGAGLPVMADPERLTPPVAVGPGRESAPLTGRREPDTSERVEADR